MLLCSSHSLYLPWSDCERSAHLSSRCGLVALWMAAHLQHPQPSIEMETVVQTALNRGFTAQGEMFSGNQSIPGYLKKLNTVGEKIGMFLSG